MASIKNYEEEVFFQYPLNMNQIDLASLILLYRSRGEIVNASPSSFLCCALENRLVKQAKAWFGKVYSQEAWDRMLTKDAQGYPLTPYELHILGYAANKSHTTHYKREFIDRYLEIPNSFGYVLINDLINFGFLEADEVFLRITDNGEKALHGLSRRLFKMRYKEEMLPHLSGYILPTNTKHLPRSSKKSDPYNDKKSQVSLF